MKGTMPRARVLLVLLAGSWLGCPGPATTSSDAGCDGTALADGGCRRTGWRECSGSFEPGPDGICRELAAAGPCADGTYPLLGQRECQPLGFVQCPAGFALQPAHSGCEAVVPAAACTGATRESFGQSACVPVGDCGAAFPPAGATLFVDARFTTTDATHFKTIGAALTAAPAGAVVAVEAGTYLEGAWPKRPVTVVGRCPEQVKLDGSALGVPGVYSVGVKGVTVRGVTLVGHFQGGRVQAGGTLTLEDVVIESPRLSGLIAWQAGSELTARRVVVRGTQPSGGGSFGANADEGGQLVLEDVVVRDGTDAALVASAPAAPGSQVSLTRFIAMDNQGPGLIAAGGRITGTSVLVARARENALGADGSDSSIELTSAELSGTVSLGSPTARGLSVTSGAKVTLQSATVSENDLAGAVAELGASLFARDSTFEYGRPGHDGDFGLGVGVYSGGTAELTRCALVSNSYYGLDVQDPGSSARVDRLAVVGTRPSGAGVLGRGVNVELGATLTANDVALLANASEGLLLRNAGPTGPPAHGEVSRLLVRDTAPSGDGQWGLGVSVNHGASLVLTDAALVGNHDVGFFMNDFRTNAGVLASATVTNLVVRGTQMTSQGDHGLGVLNGGVLSLTNAAVVSNASFGVLVANPGSALEAKSVSVVDVQPDGHGGFGHAFVGLSGGTARLSDVELRGAVVGLAAQSYGVSVNGSRISDNQVGVHVQGDSTLATAPVAAAPKGSEVVISEDTVVVDNAARTGTGMVPLPAAAITHGR